MIVQVFILIASLAALYWGAQLVLGAAEDLGRSLRLSPLAIGLFLIGLGTSLPELFVSHLACLDGRPGIALGNLIGSNLSNSLLILGVAGLLASLPLGGKRIKIQLGWHLGLGVLLTAVVLYGSIDLISASALLAFFVLYLSRTFLGDSQSSTSGKTFRAADTLKFVGGLAALFFGGEFLVSAVSHIALGAGLDEYVVSAIFVALGTSLPELVTAVLACLRKKDSDLIVGNIIGSNIFNIALVMGSLGIHGVPFSGSYTKELVALLTLSIILLFLPNFTKPWAILFLAGQAAMITFWVTG